MHAHECTQSFTRSHSLAHSLTPHSHTFTLHQPNHPRTYPSTHPVILTPPHSCWELTHSSTHSQPCTDMHSLAHSLSHSLIYSLTFHPWLHTSLLLHSHTYACSHLLTLTPPTLTQSPTHPVINLISPGLTHSVTASFRYHPLTYGLNHLTSVTL